MRSYASVGRACFAKNATCPTYIVSVDTHPGGHLVDWYQEFVNSRLLTVVETYQVRYPVDKQDATIFHIEVSHNVRYPLQDFDSSASPNRI